MGEQAWPVERVDCDGGNSGADDREAIEGTATVVVDDLQKHSNSNQTLSFEFVIS